MTTIEILRRARGLIEDPEHWTQGAWARDAEGLSVDPKSPRAVRWCAHGALWRASHRFRCGAAVEEAAIRAAEAAAERAADEAAERAAGLTLTQVNDQRGHGAVLAIFDRAIEAALVPPGRKRETEQ